MAADAPVAAILSTGDELALGQRVDTNSAWLAARLLELGVVCMEHTTVPDDLPALTAALARAASWADVAVVTGGLGPTADDLTRQALAAVLGEALVEDAASLESIRAWFARSGRELTEINRVQALRPASARSIPNEFGTAPGLAAVVRRAGGECRVFCLPGPPREMMPMFDRHAAPALAPGPDRAVLTRALPVFGLGESEIARRLGGLMDRGGNPVVGTTASGGVVTCRVRYQGPAERGRGLVDAAEREIRRRLGAYVFASEDVPLSAAVAALLRDRGQTVAVVESCTGGLVGAMLTETPGASAVFRGGWITYSNDLKAGLVGVPASLFAPDGPGAVSGDCALAMARGGLDRSGADHALAVTGVAGPEGGSPAKPVGTVWIARASRDGPTEARCFRFGGERANVRDWSARSALAILRLHLIGESSLPLMRQISPA